MRGVLLASVLLAACTTSALPVGVAEAGAPADLALGGGVQSDLAVAARVPRDLAVVGPVHLDLSGPVWVDCPDFLIERGKVGDRCDPATFGGCAFVSASDCTSDFYLCNPMGIVVVDRDTNACDLSVGEF